MATMLRSLATILAIGFLASCADSSRSPHSSYSSTSRHDQKPCADCTEGVTTVKKNVEPRTFCVVNGKQVDCTKTPAECPKCAQVKK
jgi:hypothetical protein